MVIYYHTDPLGVMSQIFKKLHSFRGQAIHPYRVGPTLSSLSPLRTVLASFLAHGSSLLKISLLLSHLAGNRFQKIRDIPLNCMNKYFSYYITPNVFVKQIYMISVLPKRPDILTILGFDVTLRWLLSTTSFHPTDMQFWTLVEIPSIMFSISSDTVLTKSAVFQLRS